ncbi:MAG: DUF294 nucleotidyltransferase-like domain-containing protein [Acidobacteriia bacterium]|nr:DUF294 nucleotidyltransferase-like domain-containing protein [Terriglobia bacterium]
MDLAGAVSQISFRDRERAQQTLAQVRERVPAGVREALPTLLADSPDPDTALNCFERLATPENSEVLRVLERNRFLVHYAVAVFAYSPWLGETLIQSPDLFHTLAREKNLDRSHSREDYRESIARFRSRSFETDISVLLARFKRREYVRILLRDVLGIAALAETTAEISALSDVLIEEALRHADQQMRNRCGEPQRMDTQGRVVEVPFAVLSLGKLGGNELNYSSDIDLLFIYGDGEPAEPREISNREYFIRLAQQVTEVLSRVTQEGAVFRIDLRLRPQGREGEPAVALSHAQRYYAETAHDWEQQAMIKVRHSAGSVMLAREFIRGVQPHVYKRELNFAAIETAIHTREKIGASRRRRAALRPAESTLDVKLDRGGIRDIEFLVQCLQRVYGGAEQWLRSGGTLFSLQKLHDKGHLSGKDFHELTWAYEFLRRVEHRLQVRRGQQVHRLPAAPDELAVLYRTVGPDRTGQVAAYGLVEALRQRMQAVAAIYQRIIHAAQQHGRQEREAGEFYLSPSAGESGREQSFQQILERLAADAPELHDVVASRDLTARTRRNLQRFLSSAFTSSERYAAVIRQPGAVERAIRLLAVSDFLTDILVRHPQEIATVAEIPETPAWGQELFAGRERPRGQDSVFDYIATTSVPHTDKLALLRQHYRHRVFTAGVRDIMEHRPVYESLWEMSEVADEAIQASLAIAGTPEGFAVLALGRLGTWEFDVGSDADLLFVRDETTDPVQAHKTAEQIVGALAAYTKEGTMFAVDARLRPRGGEGELVITPATLAAYFEQEAQAWEALTFTKLRFVGGAEELGARAISAAGQHFPRFVADPTFPAAVRAMRAKLEKSDEPGNFKVAPGGFYDIDFVCSYLTVLHAVEDAGGNIRERLYALAEHGVLSDADCATLDHAAELLRTVEHVIRLVQGKARKSLPGTEHGRETTELLVARILRRDFPQGLAGEMEQAFRVVRAVYDRVVRE